MLCLSVDNVDNFVDNLVYTLGKVKGKHGEYVFYVEIASIVKYLSTFLTNFPCFCKNIYISLRFYKPIDPGAAPSFILTLSVMTQTRQGETLLPGGSSPFYGV